MAFTPATGKRAGRLSSPIEHDSPFNEAITEHNIGVNHNQKRDSLKFAF